MPLGGVVRDSPLIYGAQKIFRGLKSHAPKASIFSSGSSFKYSFSRVIIYENKLRAYLNTPAGDLWPYLHKRGMKAVAGAKRQVGVKTGALQRSIHMRHLGNAKGQFLWIGSEKKYALLHHQGTRPHIITPNSPDGKLIFFSKRNMRVIATRQVMHPGTKPNPYLSTQLRHFRD